MKALGVEGYLRRIRRRAGAFVAVTAVTGAVGVGTLTFALGATLVGPVVSVALAVLIWLTVAVSVVLIVGVTLRETVDFRGAGAARLLSDVREELVSRVRSAQELGQDAQALRLAPDLVAAHAARVGHALHRVPPQVVVPWARLRHPVILLGVGAGAIAGMLLLGSDRGATGAWALVHPGQRDDAGMRLAAVVSRLDARLVFPGYLQKAPIELQDVIHLEAPRGTSVELSARPRVGVTSGVLEVGETRIRLSPADDGGLRGRFVIRQDGEMRVQVRAEEGQWLRDPMRRTVRAAVDRAPRAVLSEPSADRTVELREDVPIRWEADDDVGLSSVELVVQTPDGREVRRRLFESTLPGETGVSGHAQLMAAAFGARPGDELEVWLEARDGDEVSGPNEGRSPTRTLIVASEATRRAESLADLAKVLHRGLDALADRLEAEVPSPVEEARDRRIRVARTTGELGRALDGLASHLEGMPGPSGDASVYRELARRLRRAARKEARLYGARPAPHPARITADAEIVEELERDVLLLSDSLGRARLEDAAAIARELESLRRQMASLIAELRRADNAQARQELLAAIGRAEARMRELAQRLAAMAREVPSDFINTDAVPSEQAEDTLEALRAAVQSGDLADAERRLTALEQQIDAIARMLGSGVDSFAEARFGPRERALGEAMDALAGLEAEQQQLARRSGEVRRRAAERALAGAGDRRGELTDDLVDRARSAREGLEGLSARGAADPEMLERVQARLRDVEDALRTGDLGEARRMAAEASGDAEELSRDLDLSALMFPGADGATSDAAGRARSATAELGELQRDIDRAIPNVGEFVDNQGRRQMREDGRRQGRAVDVARDLEQRFAQGPDGSPLSPEAVSAMEEARASMESGRRALERGDPIESSRVQEEAARRLTELREQLEQSQRQGGGGSAGEGQGADGAPDFREKVRIPGAEEFEGPTALRRRLLDAMREEAPEGYEDAVRRYYEELLR